MHDLEVARERALEAGLELIALDCGKKADRPKLTAKTGTGVAGKMPQRAQDRAVPAEHQAEVGRRRELLDDLEPLDGVAELRRLVGGREQRAVARPGRSGSPL